ncbi:MAG: histidine kinase, partial [Pedobacter sp.]
MIRLKASPLLLHIAAWLLFMSIPILFMTQGEFPSNLKQPIFLPYLQFCGIYMALFYLHANWLIPRYFLKKKYLLYLGALILLLVAIYVVKPFDSLIKRNHPDQAMMQNPTSQGSGPRFNMAPPDHGFPPKGNHRPPERFGERPFAHFDIISIFIFMMIIGLGSAMQSMRQSQLFERRALVAEAEKASAELSFLKAQINPHFLYNTLNNIYTLCLIDSSVAAESIMKLSNIMRYVTDQSEADFVPLQDEIDCISDFIALQKLRLGKKVTLIYTVKGESINHSITPLILMTFIENAFKYGLSNHLEAIINIHIHIEKFRVIFSSENQIFDHKEPQARKGIGIEN